MKVKQLFSRRRPSVQRLYVAIVASARQPALYGEQAVPDTPEGRLVMIVLHMALAVERLKQLGERDAAQQLVEAFFTDVEGNLRESGVSDVAIPKRMRLVEALYVHAMEGMEKALPQSPSALAAAILASLPDDPPAAGPMTAAVQQAVSIRARLARLASHDILDANGWTP